MQHHVRLDMKTHERGRVGTRQGVLVALLALELVMIARGAAACESASLPAPAPPTTEYQVPSSYALTRHRIQMRDGACLDTFVLAPKSTAQTYPILLVRTPYPPTA